MQETCTKSIEAARAEAIKIGKGYQRGIKFCEIVIGVAMLIVLFTMELEAALVSDVIILIIAVISIVPIKSRYTELIKSIEKDSPGVCRALETGYERMGKRSVPVIYFDHDGRREWVVVYEDKDGRTIAVGDYMYVWHNNKKKRTYIAIYAGELL